jgi:hypothetical protein
MLLIWLGPINVTIEWSDSDSNRMSVAGSDAVVIQGERAVSILEWIFVEHFYARATAEIELLLHMVPTGESRKRIYFHSADGISCH